MKTNHYYYSCSCGSEVLQVQNYEEDQDIELCIFTLGFPPQDWQERIRWIWHILRTGEVWSDQIFLNYDTAQQLGKDLQKLTKKRKEVSKSYDGIVISDSTDVVKDNVFGCKDNEDIQNAT